MAVDINVQVKSKIMMKRLKELQKKTKDLTPFWKEVNEMLVESAVERFRTKKTPTGRPWVESAASKKRDKGNTTLVDTGRLRKSIEATYDKKEMQVGTDVKYAKYVHHKGVSTMKVSKAGKKYKGRQTWKFLGISKEDRKKINDKLKDYLEDLK